MVVVWYGCGVDEVGVDGWVEIVEYVGVVVCDCGVVVVGWCVYGVDW